MKHEILGRAVSMRRVIGVFVMLLLALSGPAAGVANPVLKRVADSGVMRFAGEYYLMGVGTRGCFYRSSDLMQWRGPFHAFSMDNDWTAGVTAEDHQIHACDISLRNGTFHLYWSVNWHELRAIGHAVSTEPLGPYIETSRQPFDGRIDPQLFVDQDGAHYFYTTKFPEGNSIWGQPMKDPWTLTGEAQELVTAIPDTWEWRDHKVNEGQYVFRYRDRYYMLYNANHTGDDYGNYALGAAETDSPLGFSNASKYPEPVLSDNREEVFSRARVLSPPSTTVGQHWRITEDVPPPDWAEPDFDDAAWSDAVTPPGNPDLFMRHGEIRTPWRSDRIWMRRGFNVDGPVGEFLQIALHYDCRVEVYINGCLAADVEGATTDYRFVPVPDDVRASLRTGRNMLAVRATQNGYAQYVDVALVETQGGWCEATVSNAGQPTVVRGPNGFEWWLIYFGNFGGDPVRHQGIERVLFHNRMLVIDGPTTEHSPGYRPVPAEPTFRDLFTGTGALAQGWHVLSGHWEQRQGECHSAEEGAQQVLIQAPAATHYLFESALRLTPATRFAGVVAWHQDDNNCLHIGIEPGTKQWVLRSRLAGQENESRYALPEGFNQEGWHTVRVEKNADRIDVCLDDAITPPDDVLLDKSGPGRPGLIAGGPARFKGVTYTRGWDEWDDRITGWMVREGVGQIGEDGLRLDARDGGVAAAVKGDPLESYEFSIRFPAPDRGRIGVFPVYVDERNYLRLAIGPESERLTLDGMRDGKTVDMTSFLISAAFTGYHSGPRSERNLRVVRLSDRVMGFVDGKEAWSVHLPGWPPSRVGIYAEETLGLFNDITLFDRRTPR